MATVFQIAQEVHITKDLIFGWVVLNKGRHVVVDFTEDEGWLMALQRAIPWGKPYDEMRLAITNRLQAVRADTKRQEEECRAAQMATLAEIADRNKRQEEEELSSSERADTLLGLEGSMSVWFGNLTPMRVYEVKNLMDGYVYCRVVPCISGYVLLDDRGVVKGEEKNLKDVAAHILRRWW